MRYVNHRVRLNDVDRVGVLPVDLSTDLLVLMDSCNDSTALPWSHNPPTKQRHSTLSPFNITSLSLRCTPSNTLRIPHKILLHASNSIAPFRTQTTKLDQVSKIKKNKKKKIEKRERGIRIAMVIARCESLFRARAACSKSKMEKQNERRMEWSVQSGSSDFYDYLFKDSWLYSNVRTWPWLRSLSRIVPLIKESFSKRKTTRHRGEIRLREWKGVGSKLHERGRNSRAAACWLKACTDDLKNRIFSLSIFNVS